jgi:peptidoglycan-N-acetylglucosamine deacetylase
VTGAAIALLLLCAAVPAPVQIAVTVDDLPATGALPPGSTPLSVLDTMLAAFRKHGLPRVYGFVNGGRLARAPEGERILRAWREAGNPLGNHTFSHASLNDLSVEAWLEDLQHNEAVLARFAPASEWKVFRYPFLFEGDTPRKKAAAKAFLRKQGYAIAEVSIDADDWAYAPPFARCLARGDAAKAGEVRRGFLAAHVAELRYMREASRAIVGREIRHVLLLHLNAIDAEQMDALLSAYEAEGARWVDLRTALADPIYAMDPGVAVKWGAAFPYLLAKGRGVKLPAPEASDEKRVAGLCPEDSMPEPPAAPAGHEMQKR